jgi:hypothetical protein
MAPLKVQGVAATGVGNVTSVTASLASTGAGNSLVALIVRGGSGDPVAAPANWTKRVGPITTEATTTTVAYIFDYLAQPGGITSVVFSGGTTNGFVGWVWEFSGVNTFDKTVNTPNQATSPITTGSSGTLSNADEVVCALLTTHQGTGPTWGSITAGFTAEAAQHTGGGATNNPSLEACFRIVTSTAAQSCSGTPSALNGGAGALTTYYAGAAAATLPELVMAPPRRW